MGLSHKGTANPEVSHNPVEFLEQAKKGSSKHNTPMWYFSVGAFGTSRIEIQVA